MNTTVKSLPRAGCPVDVSTKATIPSTSRTTREAFWVHERARTRAIVAFARRFWQSHRQRVAGTSLNVSR